MALAAPASSLGKGRAGERKRRHRCKGRTVLCARPGVSSRIGDAGQRKAVRGPGVASEGDWRCRDPWCGLAGGWGSRARSRPQEARAAAQRFHTTSAVEQGRWELGNQFR